MRARNSPRHRNPCPRVGNHATTSTDGARTSADGLVGRRQPAAAVSLPAQTRARLHQPRIPRPATTLSRIACLAPGAIVKTRRCSRMPTAPAGREQVSSSSSTPRSGGGRTAGPGRYCGPVPAEWTGAREYLERTAVRSSLPAGCSAGRACAARRLCPWSNRQGRWQGESRISWLRRPTGWPMGARRAPALTVS